MSERDDEIILLPTPTASMATGAGRGGRKGGMNLQTAILEMLAAQEAQKAAAGGDDQEV